MLSIIKRGSLLSAALSAGLFVFAPGCGGPEDTAQGQGGDVTVDQGTASSDADELGQVSARLWTGWTSEEYPPLTCTSGNLVNGVECNGRYCDNVRIDCSPANASYGSRSWSSYFSEEGTYYRYCSANEWMTGIACNGDYCDDISIECTQILNKSVGSCAWSSASYSEEDGPYQAPAGYYIRGVACYGSNCDRKKYYSCQLR